MASRGQSITVTYTAWDTSANTGKTGDAANHTLRWVKDGTSAAPTNAASEVDATNAPGVYKITLTGTECTCDVGVLSGKSSTGNVVVIPTTITFEQLPTAAPDAAGGLPISDAGGLDLDTRLGYLTSAVPTAAQIRAEIDSNSTQLGAIVADTGELQTDWADGGRLDLILDSISSDIAALNDLSAAEVNAQVLDVLNTDTFAEPVTVPAATASLVVKIGWLAALARNKITQTSTTQALRNDADSADIATATVSDDGTTYTRGEWT